MIECFRKLKDLEKIDEINKQIITNTILSFVVRGLGLLVSLFLMPAYMRYFKDQNILGFWFAMLAVLSWVLTFDLGIGNGLRNKLIKPLLEHDIKTIKTYISSAYIMSGVLALIGLVLGFVLFPLINWNVALNISEKTISAPILLEVIKILFSSILLQFFLKLIYSIFYALQKSALPNFLGLISNVLLLVFILCYNPESMEKGLIFIAMANMLCFNIPIIFATVIAFSTELKCCVPSINFFDLNCAKSVMRLGSTFFWLQIMSLVLTSTNELLIVWLTGTKNVVDYQIYNKLFSLVGTIFTLALIPVWSAVTKAAAQNNFSWISKLYKILKYISFIFIVGEFLLIFFLQFIVNIWLEENAIKINNTYAFIFAISGSLYIWHSAITSIVNGTGKLKLQFKLLTLGGLINIPVAYLLFKITGSWISIVMANVISLIPYCIIQPYYLKKYLKTKGSDHVDNI